MKEITRFLLAESIIHGEPVLLAATAGSSNEKTGDMAQIYILNPDDYPLAISKAGLDERVCGTCPLRHSLGGACYVVLFMGPRQVYKGWVDTGKRIDNDQEFLELLKGKKVRFGSYGDPAHIPAYLVSEIIAGSAGHTAYTHQWRNPAVSAIWKGRAMASCDTVSHLRTAESKGWAGFLATPELNLSGVVTCDNEVSGVQCWDCMRCNGSNGSVRLLPHGARAGSHPSMPKQAPKKGR